MIKSLSVWVLLLLLYGLGERAMALFYDSDIKSDEEVVLFPTTAHYDSGRALWHVPVHGWNFERETSSMWRSALASAFIRGLDIPDDAASQPLFRERARMFLVDNERNKRLTVRLAGRRVTAEKSGSNGHFHSVVTLPLSEVDPCEGGWLDLFASPFESKVARVGQILAQFPERRFVLVGDSGEKDPEVYAAIYSQYEGQVLHIYIRNITDQDPDAARYVETFRNVPRAHWTVFEQPETLQIRALPVSQPREGSSQATEPSSP